MVVIVFNAILSRIIYSAAVFDNERNGCGGKIVLEMGRRRSRLYMYARFTSELLSSSRGLKPVIAADISGEFKRDTVSSGVTDVSVGLMRLLSGIYPIHEPIYASGLGVLSFSPHLASSRSCKTRRQNKMERADYSGVRACTIAFHNGTVHCTFVVVMRARARSRPRTRATRSGRCNVYERE